VRHFEQPERVGYAVLLIPKSGHAGSYKIIVLSKGSDEYAVSLLDRRWKYILGRWSSYL
jgi:hypothetical protein